MPRERITTTTADTPWDVTVAWVRDGGTVQIATVAEDADERLRTWTEAAVAALPVQVPGMPGVTATATTFVGDPPATKPGSSFRMFDGWHVDLDRDGVNKLIRVLRAARDQAFGKDE